MKIFVDAGVGRLVVDFLTDAGHDVVDAVNLGSGVEDISLLELANKQGRFIITMDKDFGELAYRSGLPHAGIHLLRMDDASGGDKRNAVQMIFEKHENTLLKAFAVYNKNRLRIRTQR